MSCFFLTFLYKFFALLYVKHKIVISPCALADKMVGTIALSNFLLQNYEQKQLLYYVFILFYLNLSASKFMADEICLNTKTTKTK